jgi:hypothetical protein
LEWSDELLLGRVVDHHGTDPNASGAACKKLIFQYPNYQRKASFVEVIS